LAGVVDLADKRVAIAPQAQASGSAAMAYGVGEQLVDGQDEVVEGLTSQPGAGTVPGDLVAQVTDVPSGERGHQRLLTRGAPHAIVVSVRPVHRVPLTSRPVRRRRNGLAVPYGCP
jgi:hypothetical protein